MPSFSIASAISAVLLAVLPFLGLLVVVVVVHELGHYAIGRLLGAKVEAFAFGFGRELVGWTSPAGVRWRICLLPFGGYVKFVGDADVSSRQDRDALAALSDEERRGSLSALSPVRRASVFAAGPAANFVLAFVVFSTLALSFGRRDLQPIVHEVAAATPADEAGIQPGDRIVSIDGVPTVTFRDVKDAIEDASGRPMLVTVQRGDRLLRATLSASFHKVDGPFGSETEPYIGIKVLSGPGNTVVQSFGVLGSMSEGARETWRVTRMSAMAVVNIATGRASVGNLSGPVKMARVSDVVARQAGLPGFLALLAVVSISLGLVNLLPVPVLDGGHLALIGCEALIGGPIPDRALEISYRVGLACIAVLVIVVTANDLIGILG